MEHVVQGSSMRVFTLICFIYSAIINPLQAASDLPPSPILNKNAQTQNTQVSTLTCEEYKLRADHYATVLMNRITDMNNFNSISLNLKMSLQEISALASIKNSNINLYEEIDLDSEIIPMGNRNNDFVMDINTAKAIIENESSTPDDIREIIKGQRVVPDLSKDIRTLIIGSMLSLVASISSRIYLAKDDKKDSNDDSSSKNNTNNTDNVKKEKKFKRLRHIGNMIKGKLPVSFTVLTFYLMFEALAFETGKMALSESDKRILTTIDIYADAIRNYISLLDYTARNFIGDTTPDQGADETLIMKNIEQFETTVAFINKNCPNTQYEFISPYELQDLKRFVFTFKENFENTEISHYDIYLPSGSMFERLNQ